MLYTSLAFRARKIPKYMVKITVITEGGKKSLREEMEKK